jgi:hypothetical protein
MDKGNAIERQRDADMGGDAPSAYDAVLKPGSRVAQMYGSPSSRSVTATATK